MKHKKVIQVFTTNLAEEHFILDKFPDVWWNGRDGAIVFDIPLEREEKVYEALREYEELVKK